MSGFVLYATCLYVFTLILISVGTIFINACFIFRMVTLHEMGHADEAIRCGCRATVVLNGYFKKRIIKDVRKRSYTIYRVSRRTLKELLGLSVITSFNTSGVSMRDDVSDEKAFRKIVIAGPKGGNKATVLSSILSVPMYLIGCTLTRKLIGENFIAFDESFYWIINACIYIFALGVCIYYPFHYSRHELKKFNDFVERRIAIKQMDQENDNDTEYPMISDGTKHKYSKEFLQICKKAKENGISLSPKSYQEKLDFLESKYQEQNSVKNIGNFD